MEKYLDGWDLAAHVRFMRQTHRGSFLLVEGAWDYRILSRFVDGSACSIEVSFGKANALEALSLLEEEGFEGVVALVDADFDRLDGIQRDLEGLLLTDDHDLDLTILFSPALKTFLEFRADERKINEIANGDAGKIASLILKSAEGIGRCRWLSAKFNLMLNFNDLKFDFIDQANLICDHEVMVSQIIENSRAPRCTATQLAERLVAALRQEVELRQLVNGHDAATILGIALREIFAGRHKAQTWRSEVEAGLRLAFDYEAFRSTAMCRWLREWEGTNGRYGILKAG